MTEHMSTKFPVIKGAGHGQGHESRPSGWDLTQIRNGLSPRCELRQTTLPTKHNPTSSYSWRRASVSERRSSVNNRIAVRGFWGVIHSSSSQGRQAHEAVAVTTSATISNRVTNPKSYLNRKGPRTHLESTPKQSHPTRSSDSDSDGPGPYMYTRVGIYN
ncbi:hypothetical protein BDZ97DRAFT_82896 [Flammula alnicola]|nr:hypothetical protein BDZ97DRAFT_82896 [Flammula alnicola]